MSSRQSQSTGKLADTPDTPSHSTVSPARAAALRVLTAVATSKEYSNTVLNACLPTLEKPSDRRLCVQLVYGVLKTRNRLDAYLEALSNVALASMDLPIRLILQMGIYQIFFLDRIPSYAAISDAVSLTRREGAHKATGFVNGVLRNALRSKDRLTAQAGKKLPFRETLRTEYGFEYPVSDALLPAMGKQGLIEYAKSSLAPPAVHVRVNTLKTTPQALIDGLAARKIVAERSWVDGCLTVVSGATGIFDTPQAKKGHFFVQDLSGALSSWVLAPKRGDTVLDVAAAPGAKSFGAYLVSGGCKATACDISGERLARLSETSEALGIPVSLARRDSTKPWERYRDFFDRVICDAPCSGLGVLSRRPEIAMRFDASRLPALNALQDALLDASFYALKPGGRLVYSTCTLTLCENEERVQAFLARFENAMPDPISLPFDMPRPHPEAAQGMLSLNSSDGTDGFFIAAFTKVPEARQ